MKPDELVPGAFYLDILDNVVYLLGSANWPNEKVWVGRYHGDWNMITGTKEQLAARFTKVLAGKPFVKELSSIHDNVVHRIVITVSDGEKILAEVDHGSITKDYTGYNKFEPEIYCPPRPFGFDHSTCVVVKCEEHDRTRLIIEMLRALDNQLGYPVPYYVRFDNDRTYIFDLFFSSEEHKNLAVLEFAGS